MWSVHLGLSVSSHVKGINRVTFQASGWLLILLSGPTVIHGQALPQAAPQTQTDTQSPSTKKPATQKPSAPTAKPRKEMAGGKTAQEIANEANNPAAPVTLIQFRDVMAPYISGSDGATHAFQVHPVRPIAPFLSIQLLH